MERKNVNFNQMRIGVLIGYPIIDHLQCGTKSIAHTPESNRLHFLRKSYGANLSAKCYRNVRTQRPLTLKCGAHKKKAKRKKSRKLNLKLIKRSAR